MKLKLLVLSAVIISLTIGGVSYASSGTAYLDLLKVTGLGNPPLMHGRISIDSSSNQFKCVNPDGSSCLPNTGGVMSWVSMNGSYQNGWADYGSPYQVGQYGVDGAGRVWLRGALIPGTSTSGTVIFTLPVGFRPLTQQAFYTLCDVGASNGTAQIDVHTDGTIVILSAGCSSSTTINFSFTTN